MKLLQRLRKIERVCSPVLSGEDQRSLLKVFIEVETMVRGQPPTPDEIEAERIRLAQPMKRPTKEQLEAIAREIVKIMKRK